MVTLWLWLLAFGAGFGALAAHAFGIYGILGAAPISAAVAWYAVERWERRRAGRCSCRPGLGYVCTAESHWGEFDRADH